MLDNLKIRCAIIFSIILVACYFLWPSYQLYNSYSNIDLSKKKELEKNSLNLGLDLKGGVQIILELDSKIFLEKLVKKNLSNKSKIEFQNLINKAFNYSLKNSSNILIELNKIASIEKIKLNRFFSHLSTSSNNQEIIDNIVEQKTYAMTSILAIMRSRIQDHDQYGLGEPSIQSIGDERLLVELAGATDLNKAKDYIQRTADFELSLVKNQEKLSEVLKDIDLYIETHKNDYSQLAIPQILDSLVFPDPISLAYLTQELNYKFLENLFNSDYIKSLIPFNSKIIWENRPITFNVNSEFNQAQTFRRFYLIQNPPAISSGMIQTPKAQVADIGNDNAGQWVVNLNMTKEGRKKWSRFTGNHINRQVAIILDNKIFMAPTIRDKITSGSTQISGFANMQEAKDIASVLKAGELPAPIKAIQTNYIGPSLGKDSIKAGTSAMLAGILSVFIFIILYYKGSGLLACFALILNLLIVLAVLISLDAVLTLPGIAGLLLTVGMTIDANVIIFERIKEEIRLGNTIRIAVLSAYDKAFVTILDANITTLLTACVLSFLGSGPIKGFATTLSIGIICSMFTAIFVTKTFFLIFINKKTSLSI